MKQVHMAYHLGEFPYDSKVRAELLMALKRAMNRQWPAIHMELREP